MPSGRTYECWNPELVFSAHDTETKLLEAKHRTATIVSTLAEIPLWIVGNAGVPIIFSESIVWLIRFSCDVEKSEQRLMEAQMEESFVTTAISTYQSKIRGIQGRLDRLLSNISLKEKEHELVPAFMGCQEILVFFNDHKHPFWKKPEISSPLLVSFSAIFVAICKILVQFFDSYRSDVEKEMKLLGKVVDDYRKRFLCFRLYQPKYPLFSRKDLVDKYDQNLRRTPRELSFLHFDCHCLYKQYYTGTLEDTYGGFFDSVNEAILESKLLSTSESLTHEWCTDHNRCRMLLQIYESCFCNGLNAKERFLLTKEKEIERAIAARECLLTVSSRDAFVRHYQYGCRTCKFGFNKARTHNFGFNVVMCRSCKLSCHKGHDVVFLRCGWFYCDCADFLSETNGNCKLKLIEEKPPTKITENRDGVPVIKGRGDLNGGDTGRKAGELYYCGRKMNQCRCGNCDGFCGPKNGCPCNSCRELVVQDPKKYAWIFYGCDGCNKSIVGERFKCNTCSDYDLCRLCILNDEHEHHTFSRMMKTSQGIEILGAHRHVTCKGCKELPLCGIIYKCNQCSDYALCFKCHGNKAHQHWRIFRAVFDREPQRSEEISISKGDIIFELESFGLTWIKGLVKSSRETGIIPVSYLQPISNLRVFRAIYDYEAQDSDEVSFSKDDIIFECESLNNQFIIGIVKCSGKSGIIPVKHLEISIKK